MQGKYEEGHGEIYYFKEEKEKKKKEKRRKGEMRKQVGPSWSSTRLLAGKRLLYSHASNEIEKMGTLGNLIIENFISFNFLVNLFLFHDIKG